MLVGPWLHVEYGKRLLLSNPLCLWELAVHKNQSSTSFVCCHYWAVGEKWIKRGFGWLNKEEIEFGRSHHLFFHLGEKQIGIFKFSFITFFYLSSLQVSFGGSTPCYWGTPGSPSAWGHHPTSTRDILVQQGTSLSIPWVPATAGNIPEDAPTLKEYGEHGGCIPVEPTT